MSFVLTEEQKAAIHARRKPQHHRPNKLTEEQRRAVVLEYVAGKPLTEIAESYGVSKQTVDYHVRKATR